MGKTIYDWMTENKVFTRVIFVIAVLIILIVIVIFIMVVFGGKHGFKAGIEGIEISPIEVSKSNGVQLKSDTLKEVIKPIDPNLEVQEKSKKSTSQTSKTEVKIGDTSIVVQNQPSNINFGDNSVVGNNINSTITINPKEKLSEIEKMKLIKDLNLTFMKANRSNKSCLMLLPVYNHPQALELIEDLKPFLIDQGYNVVNSNVGVYASNPTEKISFMVQEGECLKIVISFSY